MVDKRHMWQYMAVKNLVKSFLLAFVIIIVGSYKCPEQINI